MNFNFDLGFLGNANNIINSMFQFTNRITSMSQNEVLGLITIGFALVVITISLIGINEEMKYNRKRGLK